MTFRVWGKDRPMVPTYDYDVGEADAGIELKAGYPWDEDRHVATPAGAHFYHQPIGSPIKAKVRIPAALGSLPSTNGLDTPSSAFGMHYVAKVAKSPLVAEARTLDWSTLPTTRYPLGGHSLTATEERLRSVPIRKVLEGEPLRRGYDPQILRTDDGDVVIDGHHRVAMHTALGHLDMPAKILDIRGGRTITQGMADAEAERKAAEAAREARLQAEATALAEDMVKRATAAEPSVTPVIRSVVEGHGGYMEGLEHRLKTVESTKRKLITKAHRKNTSAAGAASGLSDVLRYTAVIPTEDYTGGVKATLDALARAGFHTTMTNNYWPKGDAYSGLNILLAGKGQDMEVQFHTPESVAAKEANHDDYEIARDTTNPLEDRMAAWSRMVPKWDNVPQPDGWLDFGGLFLYDAPGQGTGRGRYIDRWTAQGLPRPRGYTEDDLADDEGPSLFGYEKKPYRSSGELTDHHIPFLMWSYGQWGKKIRKSMKGRR